MSCGVFYLLCGGIPCGFLPFLCVSCFLWFIPSLLPPHRTRGGIAARARSSAPSTHCPLPSSPSSLLPPLDCRPLQSVHALPSPPSSLLPTLDCRPLQSVHALPSPLFSLLIGRTAESPRGRARARHPRTPLSSLLPSPYLRHRENCILPFFQIAFQQEGAEIREGGDRFRFSDVGIGELDPVTDCRVMVRTDQCAE